MGWIIDPETDKRSLMMQRPELCTGEATGRACIHYWGHAMKVLSANSDVLSLGEKIHACIRCPEKPLPFTSEEGAAVVCNQYRARPKPFLARLRLAPDPGVYDPNFSLHNPLSPARIREIQAGDESAARIAQMPAMVRLDLAGIVRAASRIGYPHTLAQAESKDWSAEELAELKAWIEASHELGPEDDAIEPPAFFKTFWDSQDDNVSLDAAMSELADEPAPGAEQEATP